MGGTFLQSSDFSDRQPLVQNTSEVQERTPNDHSEELIVFDSPRDNDVVASANIDDGCSFDIPEILQDETINSLAADSSKSDKDSASTKRNDDSKHDKGVASTQCNNDKRIAAEEQSSAHDVESEKATAKI